MIRRLSLVLVVLLVSAVPALAGDSEGRISGRLLEIRPDGKLVIEEQGPWKGPGTGLVKRMVDLTPSTAIRVVTPTGRWDSTTNMPGYDIQAADFTALHVGDFVTVNMAADRSSVAASLDVARPEGADAVSAAPRLEPSK
jgi:hypothetical protein